MNYAWLREQWQRTVAAAATVVGVIALVMGWIGVSGSRLTAQEIPYLASGAIGGLFALGVAATLWLSADLRDEFVKLDEIHQCLQNEEYGLQTDKFGNEATNGSDSDAGSLTGPPGKARGLDRPSRSSRRR